MQRSPPAGKESPKRLYKGKSHAEAILRIGVNLFIARHARYVQNPKPRLSARFCVGTISIVADIKADSIPKHNGISLFPQILSSEGTDAQATKQLPSFYLNDFEMRIHARVLAGEPSSKFIFDLSKKYARLAAPAECKNFAFMQRILLSVCGVSSVSA